MSHTIKIINSINKLPIELINIIMNQYWMDIYKNNVDSINSTINDINQIINFINKFVIRDSNRIYSNTHLHYYYKKYNKKLYEIIKDKGKLLILKNITLIKYDFNNLETDNFYKELEPKIKYFAILSICMSNIQKYVIYHSFKKFNYDMF